MNPLSRCRRALLRGLALAVSISPSGSPVHAQERDPKLPLIAYVGTYSSPLHNPKSTQVDLPPGNGRGIHLFKVDRSSGALEEFDVFPQGTSPSAVVINAAGTHLYSANETDRFEGTASGSISAFRIDRATGRLILLNTVSSGGAGPAHLSIHPSGRFVLVANYFGGTVAVLPIEVDGKLGTATDIKKDEGPIGPTKASNAPQGSFAISGHDQPHAHMIEADHTGRFVIHTDLGMDRLYVWRFEERTGALFANDPASVALPPGDGPRHFAFHPQGRWFYSLQEEASNVVFFEYDPANGRFTSRQTLSSLPPGFAGSSFGSEIIISKDGRFLYAGNRLHDSIALFSIGQNGTLTYVGEEWTRGSYPRSFTAEPSGNFLYCCNQRGDNITVFRVDRDSGALRFTGHYAPVGNPSSIVFLDLGAKP